MCGIAGVLAFEGCDQKVDGDVLVRMRDAMAHRGPDGAGQWVAADGQIGLAHRRLAIIDLSDAAAQPMCNETGTLWVAYNGEIYNHGEVRRELEALGSHTWKTHHSDTEVILHAFEEWGIDCLEKFRGMFAFTLWDAHAQELWLVRDRIGVKPLYYSAQPGRLVFASEIKAILEAGGVDRQVHEEAFYHFLSFLTAPAPQTLFKGIQKLPGGTWLKVNRRGEMKQYRYWEAFSGGELLDGVSDEEIARQVLEELRASVQLRKVSDVPLGVFVSGGIDSSANAALFSEGESDPVRTFTIGYDSDYASTRNETEYARRMAEYVGAEHHELRLSEKDLLDFLPRMVRLQDEPIADPVCVPLYYVSKLARENGVTVCQVGEGADELFWGYPAWKLQLQLQRLNDWPVPRFLKRAGLAGLSLLGKDRKDYYEWLRRGACGLPVFWGGAEAFTRTEKQLLLSERLKKEFAGYSSWEALAPIRRRFEETALEKSHLNWMTFLDLHLRLPELLLMRVDKMSMGVSLESRVPFLDHRFVELALRIPEAVKTRGGTLKYVLKKAVRGTIPDELIDRRKQGFGVPVYEWLSGRLGEEAFETLDTFTRETDFFDREAVLSFREAGHRSKVWFLLNFAMWWKEFMA